jgi:uncharacterized UBP type Zn finger protein
MSDADDALVATLVDMGFDSEEAATALLITENNLAQAIDWSIPLLERDLTFPCLC